MENMSNTVRVSWAGSGSDVVLIYDPAKNVFIFANSRFYLENQLPENWLEKIQVTWSHGSKTGLTGEERWASSSLLFQKAGLFRDDCCTIPSWSEWPLETRKIEYSVATRNEGSVRDGQRPSDSCVVFKHKHKSLAAFLLKTIEFGKEYAIDFAEDVSTLKEAVIEDVVRGDIRILYTNATNRGTRTPDLRRFFGFMEYQYEAPGATEAEQIYNSSLGLECEDGEFRKRDRFGVYIWKGRSVWTDLPGWNFDTKKRFHWRTTREGKIEGIMLSTDGKYESQTDFWPSSKRVGGPEGETPLEAVYQMITLSIERKRQEEREAQLNAEEKKAQWEKALEKLKAAGTVLSFSDSLAVGNCEGGTRDFLSKYGIAVPENGLPFVDLLAHPQWEEFSRNSQFRRVILAKANA